MRSPYFAGNLAFFAVAPHHHGQEGQTGRLDMEISGVLDRLAGQGLGTAGEVNVTFVARGEGEQALPNARCVSGSASCAGKGREFRTTHRHLPTSKAAGSSAKCARVVPAAGFEPATYRLQGGCSTI